MPDRPCVFVSSTCYDLKHLRADLRESIEGLGFEALLSEFPSFPVDPDLQTVEACKKVVADKADLFVLIVGARYGSMGDGGKSVTNLEYLEAKAKGIPIYAFVDKAVKAVLPVWKQNPGADYQDVVDTPKLFAFIEGLYAAGETWVFPFENASDIKTTLRFQWPHLIKESLTLRRRMKSAGLPHSLARLEGNALRLVIERPLLWEPLFLAELLEQELRRAEDLRRDFQYGLSDDPVPITLETSAAIAWFKTQPLLGKRLVGEVRTVLEKALADGLGPPGTPMNPEVIAYATARWGGIYRQAILQGIDCRRRVLPEGFEPVAEILGRVWTRLLDDMYSGTRELCDQLARAGRGESKEVKFTLTLGSPDLSGLDEEVDRLCQRIKAEG